jgi:hypothetical protein
LISHPGVGKQLIKYDEVSFGRVIKEGIVKVAWGKVCTPLKLGGLRISSLKELGWALRMRWL